MSAGRAFKNPYAKLRLVPEDLPDDAETLKRAIRRLVAVRLARPTAISFFGSRLSPNLLSTLLFQLSQDRVTYRSIPSARNAEKTQLARLRALLGSAGITLPEAGEPIAEEDQKKLLELVDDTKRKERVIAELNGILLSPITVNDKIELPNYVPTLHTIALELIQLHRGNPENIAVPGINTPSPTILLSTLVTESGFVSREKLFTALYPFNRDLRGRYAINHRLHELDDPLRAIGVHLIQDYCLGVKIDEADRPKLAPYILEPCTANPILKARTRTCNPYGKLELMPEDLPDDVEALQRGIFELVQLEVTRPRAIAVGDFRITAAQLDILEFLLSQDEVVLENEDKTKRRVERFQLRLVRTNLKSIGIEIPDMGRPISLALKTQIRQLINSDRETNQTLIQLRKRFGISVPEFGAMRLPQNVSLLRDIELFLIDRLRGDPSAIDIPGLTGISQKIILSTILAVDGVCSRDRLHTALYLPFNGNYFASDPIYTHVSQLRSALKVCDATITGRGTAGVEIDEASRKKIAPYIEPGLLKAAA